MNSQLASRAIEGVRAERARVLSQYQRDNPDPDEDLRDQWEAYFEAEFLRFEAELCLALLVAIHHQVERDLVQMVARATRDGRELSWADNRARIECWRELLTKKAEKGWKRLFEKLHIDLRSSDASALRLLRLLANSYKHDPWAGPSKALRKNLKLDKPAKPGDKPDPFPPDLFPYGTLAESGAVKRAILGSLELPSSATYCDIAEAFLARAERFLAEVTRRNPKLSLVQPHPKGFHPYVQWPR